MKKLYAGLAATALLTLGLGAVGTPANAATPLSTPTINYVNEYSEGVYVDWNDSQLDTDPTPIADFKLTFTNKADSTDTATVTVTAGDASDGDGEADYGWISYSSLGITGTPGAVYTVTVVAEPTDVTANTNSASASRDFTVDLPDLTSPEDLVINGSWTVGGTLTATAVPYVGDTTTGSWTDGATVTYKWIVDPHDTYDASTDDYTSYAGTVLATTASPSIVLPASAAGHVIGVIATGHKAGYNDRSLYNEYWSLHTVTNGNLRMSTPKVTGKAVVGKKLKVSTGSWTAGTTFSYQWLANGAPIKKAHKSTLKLTNKQKGAKVSVVVTGHAPAGFSSTATTGTVVTSKATKKVK